MSSTSAGGSAITWKGRAASGSQNRVRGSARGWIGHPLARREFDVSGFAVAPNTPRRVESIDFIDFDVSGRAPPG